MSDSSKKTWMPVVAGILILVVGGLALLGALFRVVFGGMFLSSFWGFIGFKINAIIRTISAVIVVAGGISTLKRRVWWLALVGAILATLDTLLLGIPALILIALSKDEFH